MILVGCGYLVKSYWIRYAKPKPHLGFLEKLRCIYIYQILHLILNHYRMLTQLKKIFFEISHFWRAFTPLFWIVLSFGLRSLNSTGSYYHLAYDRWTQVDRTIFLLTNVELNRIVEITCHMRVFECKFLRVFLPVKQSIWSISWKNSNVKISW